MVSLATIGAMSVAFGVWSVKKPKQACGALLLAIVCTEIWALATVFG